MTAPVGLRSRLLTRARDASLRSKLVGVLLLLMTVAFLAIAAATILASRGALLSQLNRQVAAASARFAGQLSGPGDRDSSPAQFERVTGQVAGTLGARVSDGRVSAAAVVGPSPDTAQQVGAQARRQLASVRPGAGRTVTLTGLGEYRLLAVRRGDETLVTGLPTDPVDDTVHDVAVIELTVFAVALGGVALAGFALVRLTLRPLERITATAAGVAALPLTAGPVELPTLDPGPHADTEVGTLAAAFDRMLTNVQQSLSARQASEERLRRFLGDASHELRTPVAVVRAHAELARRTSASLPEDVDHALERIVRESERMGRMVEDMLLLARLNDGRPLAREPVDVTRIVLDTVSDARAAGPAHRWRLDLPDEPVEVVGDPHGLHQVLANLLANARQHTPAGSTVVTRLVAVDDGVVLTVADDGPGIPAAVLPDIFERFVRADATMSADARGSGLGLAIVDAIVRAHGGTTTVDSTAAGTTFTISLTSRGATSCT